MSQSDCNSSRSLVQHELAHTLVIVKEISIPEMRNGLDERAVDLGGLGPDPQARQRGHAKARQAPDLLVLTACTPSRLHAAAASFHEMARVTTGPIAGVVLVLVLVLDM